MACPLAAERIWVEKSRYHDVEREYYERLAKLLKGSASPSQVENFPINLNQEKNKKKTKRTVRKSQSPEEMGDNPEAVIQKTAAPIVSVARAKKQKKTKLVESEGSPANSVIAKDVSPTNIPEPISSEVVEETKAKKKKKKKANKDVAEKTQDLSQKENVSPNPTTENKIDSQDSNKKSKNSKNKGASSNQCTLVSEIAKARQHIKNSLEKMDGIATLAASPASPDVLDRLAAVEKDNAELRKLVQDLRGLCMQSENRVKALEQKLATVNISTANVTSAVSSVEKKEDDDDGVDLFASDSEEDDAETAKIREERLAAYAAKKSKKPALIAKSSLVLDVKPWDDETDMQVMETEVRKITTEGLLWGASKCVPVAFGIKKLSISCVVEDEKVSIDWLTEEIEKLEDYVQSVDVAAFNKI